MKYIKYTSLLAGVLMITIYSFTQTVNYETAEQAAISFISSKKSVQHSDVQFSEDLSFTKSASENADLYFFNQQSGGFIIISGDFNAYPVLAYSVNDNVSSDESLWPPAFKDMIESYLEQIEYIKNEDLTADIKIAEKWNNLISGDFAIPKSAKSIAPLLATAWNQGAGYNAQCPVDAAGPDGRVYAGCVATAMGQVIRHHEHPVSGIGSHCYTHNLYGELCADFESTVYDYSSMPNNSANAEVAKLLYHCGVSVNMGYGPSGSGAYSQSVVNALKSFFDYTNHVLLSKSAYNDPAWHRILQTELENNRPMYYAGSGSGGHAFIIDGYQATNHYHLDWGWGGSHNGYFYLTALNPGSMNFTNSQRALVGVIPVPDFTGLDVSSSVELTCVTPTSGDISTGTSYVNYYKNTYPTAVGKELVYHFTTTLPGRIRIKINNNVSGDVNTFLLSHPHQDSLMKYGTNGLIIDDADAGTYWVAVEGVNGGEPTFDIEVICPTIDADLIIEYPFVSHEFIESELDNVIVKSTIRNIGNTPAAACDIEYFISDDTSFDFGTDIYIDSDAVPALNPGEFVEIETILTMPAGLTPGSKYLVFNVDRLIVVPESDNENLAFINVTIPDAGLLDCSAAITLQDGVWYYGNTTTDGVNNVEQYWPSWDMTGPEVIHSFVAPYSGTATISFTNTVPGNLVAMIFPICNENTYFASLWMSNVYDTITSQERYVTANTEYFVVVDGQFGVEGEYGLLIELPGECPDLTIEYSGSLELCDGDAIPSFWTTYGYSDYMWYKDGVLIPNETESWFSPSSVGEYYVAVDVNGCVGQSDPVQIQMDYQPDTAQIASLGAIEFCEGLSVDLEIVTPISFDINWTLNGEEILGATSDTYTATESGEYTLISKNGVCKVNSENSIDVIVNSNPADVGETLRVPSDDIKFYYTFDENDQDLSPNNYTFSCWSWYPANDRFDNLFQARDFSDQEVKGYVSNNETIPDEFTLNMWFKTTSDEGGLLVGFFNSPWNAVTKDAILYMSDDGRIHFYLSNGGSPVELSSTESYNDGDWHQVLIMHDFGMLMNINDGDEFLQIATEVTKQGFSGYWTFGGINNLPINLVNHPSSNYINAKVDDILCIYEGNAHIHKYNNIERLLDVNLATSAVVCDSDLVYFDVNPSEYNIEYKVWNNTSSAWYPVNGTGTGEAISIGGSVPITETTEFLIYAVNNDTGCETLLSDSWTVEVWDIETPNINIISDAPAVICEGTTVNFTANITEGGSSPIIEWYVNSVLQTETSDMFSIVVTEDIDVYAMVYNSNPCATSPNATSNLITLNNTEILEAEVNIVSDQTDEICEGVEVTFNANTTNAGASPIFEWYVNGNVQTESSDEFSITPTEDIEVYAIVVSNYDCPLNATETSNTNETTVLPLSYPLISVSSDAPADICEGTEIVFTADVTNPGSSPVFEWYVNGDVQTETGSIFTIEITENIDVYAIVNTSNPCASDPSATSNLVELTLAASPNLDIYQTIYRCFDETVTFHAPTGFDSYLWSDGTTIETLETSLAGIYTLTVTNEYGCVAIDNIEIENHPDNSFTLPEDTTLCIGENLIVSVPNIYESYSWEVGYGDEFGDIYEITVTFHGHSTMPVSLIAEDENCTYTGTFWVDYTSCTNIDNAVVSKLNIYPNPVEDILNIENSIRISLIKLLDITGKEILIESVDSYIFRIDVSNLAPATYIIEITDIEDNTHKLKFIRQ
jgi:hypothetical protein